jgi:hypothetical protein
MASPAEVLDGVNGTPQRLEGFLKTDAKITARLNELFKDKKLSPKVRGCPHVLLERLFSSRVG